VLLRVSGPNTLVSVAALPGIRYFITVVTSTHISSLVVTATRLMHPRSFERQRSTGHIPLRGWRPACRYVQKTKVGLRERASGVFKGIALSLGCRVHTVMGRVWFKRPHQSACPTWRAPSSSVTSFSFFHCSHTLSLLAWQPMISSTNLNTRHTSKKLLTNPKLILTTPSSLPTSLSKSLSVTPSYNFFMSPEIPRMAAAPPGLHIQPVRREIFEAVAAYSIKELGIISPDGCIACQKWPEDACIRRVDKPKGIRERPWMPSLPVLQWL